MRTRHWLFPSYCLACLGLLGCGPQAPLFSQDFVNFTTGALFPITPGPSPGFVMSMGNNNTDFSIEFVVTAETEEILAEVDGSRVVSFTSSILETRTSCLFTDVNARSLGTVFDNTPVDWPPVQPGLLTLSDVQSAIDQLAVTRPEEVNDRDLVRMLRVLRIGLGPSLDVPSDSDNGIIQRPPGTDVTTVAGTVLPSGVNTALSYDFGNDPADFGNGDMVLFLATSSSTAIGGVIVQAGVVDGEAGSFERNTFEILRRELGPISPLPQ